METEMSRLLKKVTIKNSTRQGHSPPQKNRRLHYDLVPRQWGPCHLATPLEMPCCSKTVFNSRKITYCTTNFSVTIQTTFHTREYLNSKAATKMKNLLRKKKRKSKILVVGGLDSVRRMSLYS